MLEQRFLHFLFFLGTALCAASLFLFYFPVSLHRNSFSAYIPKQSETLAFRPARKLSRLDDLQCTPVLRNTGSLKSFNPEALAQSKHKLFRLFGYIPEQSETLFGYSYQGPTNPIPGDPSLIHVEIMVRDSPESGGVQIRSVSFNDVKIPLKPRDIYGNRGTAGFRLPSGRYDLVWTVQRDKLIWPRILSHQETVTLDPRDLWIQVEIVGEEASIR